MIETSTSDPVECEPKLSKFSNRYGNAIYHISSFAPGDEPTKAAQKLNSRKKQPQRKEQTIDFTSAIQALHDPHETRTSMYSADKPCEKNGRTSVPTVSSVFQPIYHTTKSNEVCLLSDNSSDDLNACFSNNDCRVSDIICGTDSDDNTEWYDEVDIHSIGLVEYYKPMATDDEVYNEVEVLDIPDEATVQHNNCQQLFKLEDPYKF